MDNRIWCIRALTRAKASRRSPFVHLPLHHHWCPKPLFLSRFLLAPSRAEPFGPGISSSPRALYSLLSMGNSTSNAANPHAHSPHSPSPRRTQSPVSRGGSPVPSSNRVHKSLRSKKKSLELPDLASLALTPASNSPSSSPHGAFRRPRASSPIPIPISPRNNVQGSFRVQGNMSAAQLALSQNGRGQRYRSYISSANQSTNSFVSKDPEPGLPPHEELHEPGFVPEVVTSTIPIALPKVEMDVNKPEHVTVTIKWRGGGRSVVLARAGDDYWKGRQPMEYE